MNLEPKFEQYKLDQARILQIPIIEPGFQSVINDLSSKILSRQELTQKEIGDLEMIYNMTQSLEKEIGIFLDHYRSKNIVTKSEFLIIVDYFLMANENGPDSAKVKNELISSAISSEDFGKLCEEIAIPTQTCQLFRGVYKKIKEYKNSSLK